MLTAIYFILIIITMPFFIKKTDRCLMGYVCYFGCCMLFTPIVGIPVWKFLRGS